MTHSIPPTDTDTEPTAWIDRTIGDLVAAYPETMTVLAPLGIDLCCGGAYRLGEALDLHQVDRAVVLLRLAPIVGGTGPKER